MQIDVCGVVGFAAESISYAYLDVDPSLNVTVLPLMVKRVPAGDFRKNSYLPAMSKKRTPVYLTAKLYFLAAISALTPLKDKAAACRTTTLLACLLLKSIRASRNMYSIAGIHLIRAAKIATTG